MLSGLTVYKKKLQAILEKSTGLVITLGASLILATLLILTMSAHPAASIRYFFLGPFHNLYYFGNMLNSAVPLIFAGLGVSLAMKAGSFNLGGEGQLYAGALTATFLALALGPINGFLGVFVSLAGAALVSGFLAGISGYFKMRWNTNELISSFLLSNAVILMVNYLITGPLKDPDTNLLTTAKIPENYFFRRLLPPSNLSSALILAVAAAVLVNLYIFQTRSGYEMRMCGQNREFSHYGGIDIKKFVVLPMILSGAMHGLGGGTAVIGTYHMCIKEFSGGMGWNGIAVALIARYHPLGVIPAALFFAYIEAGAKSAMLHSDVTFEIAAIVQSMIFFLITAQVLYTLFRRKEAATA